MISAWVRRWLADLLDVPTWGDEPTATSTRTKP